MPGPNFVVILSDDQAACDLGCLGATDLATPRFDRLAASGVILRSWYSNSPVCSPARASLLTGRYPGNAGVRSILRGHRLASGLPASVPTLAAALRPLGYRSALFGKWHLGVKEGSRPHDRGFDEWFGFLAGCVDYYSHIFYWDMDSGHDPTHDLWEDGREVWRNGEYFTALVTERAVAFVRRMAREERTFFLYVPYSAPHYPLHAPKGYLDRFSDLPEDRRIMAAMLAAMDDGVGAILDELERQGLREDTCVFFQSDNGPSRETRNRLDGRTERYYGGGTCSLKGHKFSLFDGGIRSPAILSWPARVGAGREVRGVGVAMDIFPTFLRAAGGDRSAYELDGLDVLPMLAGGAPSPHGAVFWEMGRQTAVRRGKWKLVLNGQLVESDRTGTPSGRVPPEDQVFLADLDADPGEMRNLRDAHPDLVRELRGAAETWRRGIEERWEREWGPQLGSAGVTGYTFR
ncbi:MAG: sulfatase family protein [Thermoleophilaceae bacterium]